MIDPRIRGLHIELERRHPRLHPPDIPVRYASVALLIRPATTDLEILLIERPVSEHDPWSGHMALPGGRREGTESALDNAIRETMEEVGIDLRQSGMLLGRLDDVSPYTGGPQIAVSPFVFSVPGDTQTAPDPREVAHTLWIPLEHLTNPASAAEHLHPLADGGRLRFPAFRYDRHVIWGLTYRMLIQFLGVARAAKVGTVR